jgi:hypothetical protein
MTEPKKLSQLERTCARLRERGSISRNECLGTFPAITQRGARVDDLEKEGCVFDVKHEHGDYVYGSRRHRRRTSSAYEFQGLLYQRPCPYQPPPNSRRRTTMMRIVVVSMSGSYSGAISAPHNYNLPLSPFVPLEASRGYRLAQ